LSAPVNKREKKLEKCIDEYLISMTGAWKDSSSKVCQFS